MQQRLLHVGCGVASLPSWLDRYEETRVDINPDCKPDIIANMLNLGDIGEFDCVYSNHALEHLYPHEIPQALSEFMRVLKHGGALIVFVPDCEDVKPTNEVLFSSDAGDIAGLDLLYGLRSMLAHSPFMAHHMAFTQGTLLEALDNAGYSTATVKRLSDYALMGAAIK